VSGGPIGAEEIRAARANAAAAMQIRLGPTLCIDAMFWLGAVFSSTDGPGVAIDSDELREGLYALLTGATEPNLQIVDGAALAGSMLGPGPARWFDIQDALERARLFGFLARVRVPAARSSGPGASAAAWKAAGNAWIYAEDIGGLARLAVGTPSRLRFADRNASGPAGDEGDAA